MIFIRSIWSFCILIKLYLEITVLLVKQGQPKHVALSNFILTVAGVSAVILLMRSDVKQWAAIFGCNVRHIRNWLEEESASAAKEMVKVKPKEITGKDMPEEKH